MFLKLIKHELRASGRLMLPLLALLPAIAAMSALSIGLNDQYDAAITTIATALTTFAFVLGIFAVLVMAFVVMIMRFKRSMLSDEGYLTNTLPVSVHSLVWSRLATALIYYLLAVIAVIISIAIFLLIMTAFGGQGVDITYDIYNDFSDLGIDPSMISTLTARFVWTSIVALVASCLQIYAALALGHSMSSNHKMLLSVVFFFALNTAASIVTGLTNLGNVMSEIQEEIVDVSQLLMTFYSNMLLITAIVSIVLGAAYYVITVLMLKKKLNLA